jgi:GntR family transcriptional regulator
VARYREIADELRKQIKSGVYRPGDKLPSYEDLTRIYGVGRGVIRQALSELESDGLVRVVKKSGITVRKPGERRRLTRSHVVTRNPRRGYVFPAAASPDEPWMTHGQPRAALAEVPYEIADILGVGTGSKILRRRRVTSPEGEPPFQLVDTWIHPSAVTDAPQAAEPSTGPGGYLDRLEEAGHGPVSWYEIARSRMPEAEEARLLDMPRGMPVLVLTRVGTSARTKRPIEVTTCVIPADRVEIASQLRRGSSAQWPVEPIAS